MPQIAIKVADDDKDEVSVILHGKQIRSWEYRSEGERRAKMLAAREFVEIYLTGREDALAGDPEPDPEPEGFEDAMARKADAQARYESDMIGAGRGHLIGR